MRNEPSTGRPTVGSGRPGAGNTGGPANQRNSNSIWLAAAAVLSVLILALAVLNYQKLGIFGESESSEEAAAPTNTPPENNPDDQFPDSSQLQAQVNGEGTAWVVGHQEDFKYRISGVVPSEEVKDAISKSVTESYTDDADSVKNELVVDPNLPDSTWVEGSSDMVRAIQFTLIDGAFAVNEANTNLSGQAQNQEQIDSVIAAAETAGLPEVKSSIDIVDLRPPTIIANAKDGELDLVGSVPNQLLVDQIVADATALYGDGNVKQNLSVDDGTFARFSDSKFGSSTLGVFQPLGNYQFRLEQGSETVSIEGGVLFDPGSSQLSSDTQTNLTRLPDYISARSTRPVSITGHADNIGDPIENQELSQARADAVKEYLVENGAPDQSISAEGKGEQPGDSPEERAKNRRVEIAIGAI